MKWTFIALLLGLTIMSCTSSTKDTIAEAVGLEEYDRLMQLSLDDFDQSSIGFRSYSNNYEITRLLIPEYISVNQLTDTQSRNLHWHLGQIHAFNEQYEAAVAEMKQAYAGGSTIWECYVSGTIAFLEQDKAALLEALETLRKQDNHMNIEFLEKFVLYFDQPYAQAYNADL